MRSSNFTLGKIESQTASFLNTLAPVGETFGRQLVSQKLAEGFTVIHDEEGNDEVSLGIVELGKTPFRAFNMHGQDRLVLENTRTEVHQNQRDFLGPFEITGDGQPSSCGPRSRALPSSTCSSSRGSRAKRRSASTSTTPRRSPLAQNPGIADVIRQRQEYQRGFVLPKGQYYVIVDNTPTAGVVNPPQNVLDDRAAVVSYAISVGEAP